MTALAKTCLDFHPVFRNREKTGSGCKNPINFSVSCRKMKILKSILEAIAAKHEPMRFFGTRITKKSKDFYLKGYVKNGEKLFD